jgi:hypothetical protein
MDTNPLETAGWNAIVATLPPNWKARAAEMGLCPPSSTPPEQRSKLGDPATLLRLVLHHVATETPLDLTVAQAHATGLVSVSKVALHYRLRQVGPWLSELATGVAQADRVFAPARWGGYRIFCTDATTGCRPGACGTTFRVHYRVEAATLRPAQFVFTDEHGGEMLRRFPVTAGDLDLLDRGYCTAADIDHADVAGGAVIVRFARGMLPLFNGRGHAIDIKPRVLALRRPGRIRAWTAWVHGPTGRRMRGRIVALRLNAVQAAKALARLRREKAAKDITAADVAWTQYVVVFTTVPPARLSAPMVIELYRLRWMAELQIKRDKSIGGIDHLPNFRDDTIASWVSAKLLALAIARRFAEALFPPCATPDGAAHPAASRHAA